ncbi:DUF424 family protein [Candidatus Micrarchaeota archaeon]|nr:DUF424 family protein [Candidatus Micrarchaeota archaeon]MBU2476371.1 DUF424 family protein [Candidatus Micrarchaeota archaeon]
MHLIQNQKILAVCDKELIGKILDKETEFKARKEFYGEKEIKKEKLRKLFRETDSVNLLGEKSVSVALKEKIAGKENIIRINNVPHIQVYFIKGENT